jgi:excisionase family DNA binding protein
MPTISGLRELDSERTTTEHLPDAADLTLLTVGEVAALLKVSKSWVYEHTRSKGARGSGLPFVKIGKYVRFDVRQVREFLAARTRRA